MDERDLRNYGIDVARIIAILFVVIIHNFGNGGILNAQREINNAWFVVHFAENLGIVAVNVFGMITGYLMVGRKFKAHRVLDIAVTTIFWSLVMTLIFKLAGFAIPWERVFINATPITHRLFWYTNAYIVLALIAPFINAGIEKVDEPTFRRLLIVILISAGIGVPTDSFFMLSGYSGIWLVVLYLLGAYIKLYGDRVKLNQFWLVLIYIFAALVQLAGQYLLAFKPNLIIGGYKITPDIFGSYVAMPVVVGSAALFVFFERIKVKKSGITKLITFLSPLTFGVYLIDMTLLTNSIIAGKFAFYALNHGIRAVGFAVLLGVGLFVAFSFMEWIRQMIFKGLKIDNLLKAVTDMFIK